MPEPSQSAAPPKNRGVLSSLWLYLRLGVAVAAFLAGGWYIGTAAAIAAGILSLSALFPRTIGGRLIGGLGFAVGRGWLWDKKPKEEKEKKPTSPYLQMLKAYLPILAIGLSMFLLFTFGPGLFMALGWQGVAAGITGLSQFLGGMAGVGQIVAVGFIGVTAVRLIAQQAYQRIPFVRNWWDDRQIRKMYRPKEGMEGREETARLRAELQLDHEKLSSKKDKKERKEDAENRAKEELDRMIKNAEDRRDALKRRLGPDGKRTPEDEKEIKYLDQLLKDLRDEKRGNLKNGTNAVLKRHDTRKDALLDADKELADNPESGVRPSFDQRFPPPVRPVKKDGETWQQYDLRLRAHEARWSAEFKALDAELTKRIEDREYRLEIARDRIEALGRLARSEIAKLYHLKRRNGELTDEQQAQLDYWKEVRHSMHKRRKPAYVAAEADRIRDEAIEDRKEMRNQRDTFESDMERQLEDSAREASQEYRQPHWFTRMRKNAQSVLGLS